MFRDVTLQPTEPLQSELDLRMLGITYGYSFWHGEKLELAATWGSPRSRLPRRQRARRKPCTSTNPRTSRDPSRLPASPRHGSLSKRFYLDGRVQSLHLHIKEFDGTLGMAELAALYRFRPNVSFALGYTGVKAHLDSRKTHESGLFDFNTKGPEIFVRVSF